MITLITLERFFHINIKEKKNSQYIPDEKLIEEHLFEVLIENMIINYDHE